MTTLFFSFAVFIFIAFGFLSVGFEPRWVSNVHLLSMLFFFVFLSSSFSIRTRYPLKVNILLFVHVILDIARYFCRTAGAAADAVVVEFTRT